MGAVLDKLEPVGMPIFTPAPTAHGLAPTNCLVQPGELDWRSSGFVIVTRDELLALAKEIEELANGLG